MKEINSVKDLKIGTIFKCSWNGMADYYEMIGSTEKTIKLREIKWTCCSNPNPNDDDFDPTYRWTKIVRDDKGNTVPKRDFEGNEIIYSKRIINLPNGGITFKSPNYSGDASVSICTNDYMRMYWG